MIATTRPLALTAFDLMNRDVVTISRDTPLRMVAELLLQRHIGEAAVVDTDGRCVGMLAATDLIRSALEDAQGGAEAVPPPACSYQVRGRLLTGGNAVICTQTKMSCPMQEVRPMTGGRHTIVCQLREGILNDWQEVSGDGNAGAARRFMTAGATVEAEAPLSVLARILVDVHVPTLIVVDEQHRPIGTVSCLAVLAALAHCVRSMADG
jgi:CBS domain-containing protein